MRCDQHHLMLFESHAYHINIDEQLLKEAIEATGESERTRLIHDGLRALIARENARAIIALRGTEPNA